MASVRRQIFLAVQAKLELVAEALGWAGVLVNPREPVGEDQMNALVLMHGGDGEPSALTGHVGLAELELSVGMIVAESAAACAEDLLDAGFVAVSNALLDPADIQLGALAVGIRRLGISEPAIGRSLNGARVLGGQSIDFAVQYLEREGDAEIPGP